MFEDFANVWTPLGLACDLKAGRPMSIEVANVRVVLFRDRNDQPVALIDQCPHRGVALSLGKVKAGEIECPFHGWRFDGAGRNVHVPWNADAKRETLCATSLPLQERAGLLWLYTGFAPETGPVVSASLEHPNVVITAQHMTWDVHWTRVMENMLDTPHLPFVHRKTIGRSLTRHLGEDMEMRWTPTATGGHIQAILNGTSRSGGLVYGFPNVMELVIDPPGKLFRLMAVCTPQSQTTTRLSIYTLRNFARLPFLNPVFRKMNLRIALEDKAVVESSRPSEVPPPGTEKSVRTDRPTLAFRKIYFDRLKGSRASRPEIRDDRDENDGMKPHL